MNNSGNIVYTGQGISQWLDGYRDKWEDFYPSERWAFERLAGPQKALGRILDVGCGMGGVVYALTSKFHLEHYYGVDINKQVIDKALAHRDKFKAPVMFECQDILQVTHLPRTAFDIVFSLSCADWNIETKKIIDCCWSYVKPGGYFVISIRLTPREGVNDISRSYQNIAHDAQGRVVEVANYVVFNGREFFCMVETFEPKPMAVAGYGYWRKPSPNAVTLYQELIFGVVIVQKGLGETPVKIDADLRFPLDLWTASK